MIGIFFFPPGGNVCPVPSPPLALLRFSSKHPPPPVWCGAKKAGTHNAKCCRYLLIDALAHDSFPSLEHAHPKVNLDEGCAAIVPWPSLSKSFSALVVSSVFERHGGKAVCIDVVGRRIRLEMLLPEAEVDLPHGCCLACLLDVAGCQSS